LALSLSLFFHNFRPYSTLHSFPTRRSSDLIDGSLRGKSNGAGQTYRTDSQLSARLSQVTHTLLPNATDKRNVDKTNRICGFPFKIGRAHVRTPVTSGSRMPSSA